MQGFAALMMTVAIAATTPAVRDAVRPADAAAPAAEAYVAVLDAQWNVTREMRVACPVESGCAVDLALGDPEFSAVHVRFDPPQAGAVAVTSRLEHRDGRASQAEDEVLSLDHTGFAAGHYDARTTVSTAEAGPIVMVAVRVPGWTSSAPAPAPAPAQRT